MVAKRKKQYTTGEGAQFISRKQALRKLQLTLDNFRRLCIIKGIYPREPRNRKRAQKGSTGIKTLYHMKDIQFLMHEPMIWKLREYKIFNRKVGRARAIQDFKQMKKYLNKHPTIKLDHIVKERYPTFIDAIRDLDDSLSLCFLFSTFPSIPHIPREQSDLCRRLTVEFMHYVIESKSLRKVFISIKGYYYQAEIKGQTVTWIVPHHFAFEPQQRHEVDFKIMSTFVEFYIVLLGFVNFRLYHSLNLYYPPKFEAIAANATEQSLVDENIFVAERVAALNIPIVKSSNNIEEDVQIDSFGDLDDEAKTEAVNMKNLQSLFKGMKFYLNREVPREPLVFIIRCLGGEVSWDQLLFVGATYADTDETITHHIVDRPSIDKQYISRYYLQPQWVFDCVNTRSVVEVSKYFIGEVLPPHLSPFVDKDRDEQYVPPEEKALYDQNLLEEMRKKEEEDENDEENEVENQNDDDMNEDEGEIQEQTEDQHKTPKLEVKPGQVYKDVPWEQTKQEKQEYRLREKMIQKKYRNLYKGMKKGKQERAKEVWLLKKKRRLMDEKNSNKKETKKTETGKATSSKSKKP